MTSQGHTIRFQTKGDRYGAFTLIELLVSMVITAIIMLAIGSAMLVATHAMPDPNRPANQIIVAGEVAEQLATELQYAITFTERTANAVEFTVADRDANGVPETIRYAWSGTAGDPLTRQYNGGTVVTIAEDVQEFDLSYEVQTISALDNESDETLLISYDSTEDLYGYRIKKSESFGEYFFPSLPAQTVSWKVTRVRFKAKTDGAANGECKVQLQLSTQSELPSGTVLEEKTLLESSLTSSYTMQELSFSNVSGLSPEQGLCLVFKWISNATVCRILGQDEGVEASDIHLCQFRDQGSTWSERNGESLLFWIYGRVTTGEPQIVHKDYLKAVRIKLRAGNDELSTVYGGVQVLNAPEVPAP